MNNIGDLLREAAIEVEKEEKEVLEDVLVVARDEVVAENNNLTNPAVATVADTTATNNTVTDIAAVIDDVNALLKDMNIQPKYSSTDAKTKRRIIPKRRAKDDSNNDRRHTRQLENNFYSTEPSRVSVLLEDLQDDSDDDGNHRKPYYDNIKFSFMSPAQELLFRTMKVITRTNHSKGNPVIRASSSARGHREDKDVGGTSTSNGFRSSVSLNGYRTSVSLNGWRSKVGSSVNNLSRNSLVGGSSSSMLSSQHDAIISGVVDNGHYDQLIDFHSCSGGPSKRNSDQKKKVYEDMRASVHSLAGRVKRKQYTHAELKADPSLRYAKLEDAKECYFHPRVVGSNHNNSNNRNDSKEEEEAKSKFSFAMRQENKEKLRVAKLQDRAGKADYDCLVDKKVCPQCRMKQTYEEWKERRKKCPMCNVEYCAAVDWNKAGHRFFRSHHEYAQKVADKKVALRVQIDRESKSVDRFEVDPRTGRSVVYKDPHYLDKKLTNREETEFYYRINDTLEKKVQKIKQLDEELFKSQHTFKPAVREYRRPKNDDDYLVHDDEEERDPVEEFEKRYAEDLEMRREKFPTKYLRPKVQIDDYEPFRLY